MAVFRIVLNHETNKWGFGPVDVSAADETTAIAAAKQAAADEYSFKAYATQTADWSLAAAPEVVG